MARADPKDCCVSESWKGGTGLSQRVMGMFMCAWPWYRTIVASTEAAEREESGVKMQGWFRCKPDHPVRFIRRMQKRKP